MHQNVEKKNYGGDAYTGIQNAAADTANNVYAVGSMVRHVGSSVVEAIYFVAGMSFLVLSVLFFTLGLKQQILALDGVKDYGAKEKMREIGLSSMSAEATSVSAELEENISMLKHLVDVGIISDKEYEQKKDILLEKERQKPRFCHNCGSQVTPGSKFCSSCGTEIASVQQTTTADTASVSPVSTAPAEPAVNSVTPAANPVATVVENVVKEPVIEVEESEVIEETVVEDKVEEAETVEKAIAEDKVEETETVEKAIAEDKVEETETVEKAIAEDKVEQTEPEMINAEADPVAEIEETDAGKPEEPAAPVDRRAWFDEILLAKGENIGQCDYCGRKYFYRVFANWEDKSGKSSGDVCCNCFESLNIISDQDQVAE